MALAVLPQRQGMGIGKILLEGLEQETKRRGYECIRLNSADIVWVRMHFMKKYVIFVIRCRNGLLN